MPVWLNKRILVEYTQKKNNYVPVTNVPNLTII
jgi:hypothetical protein